MEFSTIVDNARVLRLVFAMICSNGKKLEYLQLLLKRNSRMTKILSLSDASKERRQANDVVLLRRMQLSILFCVILILDCALCESSLALLH